ncbi:hypothetical protein MC885_002293 [Smutsia gigantea]|nr:hypothetical protein MC885_002293 [Smutsia gigantea]
MRLHLATRSPGNRKVKHWSRWSPSSTMVDKKWLLGPGPLEPTSLGVNSKPWYKDKLTCKCLTKQKNRVQKCPIFLDSRQWIFVKEGMDDFRWGCPPCEDLFTRTTKEDFLPLTAHREHNGERKLRKPHDPHKPNWVKIRHGAWYLKPQLWKKLINDEPLIDSKGSLEDQYEKDILEDLKGTIAFKDFILSKGYKMLDLLVKLFIRKGRRYDSVKTPVRGAIKITEEEPREDD